MLFRKEKKNGKKYINILGLKIPYRTQVFDDRRIFFIGGICFSYWYDSVLDSPYLKWWGRKIYLHKSDKLKHYQMREELTAEKCQMILEEKLTPLLGYKPDLTYPKSFNEKINWMKLHDHNPLITTCCDKYAVKEYAKNLIGEQYVLPVLGKWKDATEIKFDMLPNRFVLKVNWSSGFNIIVKDKTNMDTNVIIKKLNDWIQPHANSYYALFNWGYKDMQPVIYAEPYIEQIDGQVYDYKFFICNGKYEFMIIATNRQDGETLTYFGNDFQKLDLRRGDKPNAIPTPEMPKNLSKMIKLAEKLAKPFPFVRVDFYEIENKVYLGEMTFYTAGGSIPFDPPEWDWILGEKIPYPMINS